MNLLTLFFSLLTATAPIAITAEVEKASADPVWGSLQEILDLGIVEMKFKGKYGEFFHNAFNYKAFKNNEKGQELIKKQIELLKKIKPPTNRFDKLSFWMNAYNFYTVVEINKNFPIKSMKDLGWKNRVHNINGTLYSLDHIEHKIIRPMGDPKIHFSINCASVSCPNLAKEIFKARGIGLQMKALVSNAYKNPLHARLEGGDLQMTKLLDWFDDDFEAHPYKSQEGFIKTFAPPALQKKIDGWITYNWALNNSENIQAAMKKLGAEELK